MKEKYFGKFINGNETDQKGGENEMKMKIVL